MARMTKAAREELCRAIKYDPSKRIQIYPHPKDLKEPIHRKRWILHTGNNSCLIIGHTADLVILEHVLAMVHKALDFQHAEL